MIESVPSWREKNEQTLQILECILHGNFIGVRASYLCGTESFEIYFSVWGLIDLLSILPTYLTFFIPGYQSVRIIRALRLLRIFRILQLPRFTSESQALFYSLKASYYKIIVFFLFVIMITICCGTLMYVLEGGDNGFESIPASIYWAIVTITTVGFRRHHPWNGSRQVFSFSNDDARLCYYRGSHWFNIL